MRKINYLIRFITVIIFFIGVKSSLRIPRSSYKTSRVTIYYTPHFDINNNVTGTGDKLADIVYQAICNQMMCSSCCEGEINEMYCGSVENCIEYINYTKMITIVVAVCVSVGGFLLLTFLICVDKRNKGTFADKTRFYFKTLAFIICGICIIFYRLSRECSCCSKSAVKRKHNQANKNIANCDPEVINNNLINPVFNNQNKNPTPKEIENNQVIRIKGNNIIDEACPPNDFELPSNNQNIENEQLRMNVVLPKIID
jgi:hypothetical protein